MMRKQQILWAIVFGSMLAITGCGDDGGGSGGTGTGATGGGGTGATGGGGTGATGGSSGGDDLATVCDAICGNCGDSTAQCQSGCEDGFGSSGELDFESCTDELDTFSTCVDTTNSCLSFALDCGQQYVAWVECVSGLAR